MVKSIQLYYEFFLVLSNVNMYNHRIQIKNKCIRLFISSTFSDFTEERRILNEEVFPIISTYCEDKGFVFQVVDLRYGVPLAASEDHTIMKICLEEVERCRNTGYYLNFLMMLGNRYGYTPEPGKIVKEDFEVLIDWVERNHSSMADVVKAHYRLDENCLPPSYVYCSDFNNGTENRDLLQSLFKKAYLSNELHRTLGSNKVNEYFLSATGQEIWKGMMTVDDGEFLKHIVCVFRHDGTRSEESSVSETALRTLVSNVRAHFSKYNVNDPVFEYDSGFPEKTVYFDAFKHDMLQAVKRFVDDSIDQYISANLSDQIRHEVFLKNYLKIPNETCISQDNVSLGRDEEIRDLLSFAQDTKAKERLCLFYGESGKGKTYLTALSILSVIKYCNKDDIVIYRFVGATPGSNNPFILIESIYQQLCSQVGIKPNEHSSYSRACDALKYVITEYFSNSNRKLYIFIDAVDQIVFSGKDEKFLWLPDDISGNIKCIFSSTSYNRTDYSLKHKTIRLSSLSKNGVSDAIKRLLSTYSRSVTDNQMILLLSAYEQVDLPIYMNYMVNLVKNWHSWDSYMLKDLGIFDSGMTPNEYINSILSLYTEDLQRRYGQALVKYTLGYIYVSEHGLAEKELLQLLALTPEVIAEYAEYYHVNENDLYKINVTGELPYMVWSRLYYNIRSSLKEVELDGFVLYDFYHLTASRAVANILGDTFIDKCSLYLSTYFENKPYFHYSSYEPNKRKINELTYQYINSDRVDSLYNLVMNPEYVSSMYRSRNVNLLITVLKRVWCSCSDKQDAIATEFFNNTLNYYVKNDITARFLEILHSALAFDEDMRIQELHKALFENGYEINTLEQLIKNSYSGNDYKIIAKLFELQCKTKRMNSLRRNKSNQEEVTTILDYLESDNGINIVDSYLQSNVISSTRQAEYIYEELSRLYYEISYVNYLSGDVRDAKRYMKESIYYARLSKNVISLNISILVYFQIILYTNPLSIKSRFFIKSFIGNIKGALEIFRRNSSESENASRWISNAEAYLVQAYYFAGNYEKTRYFAYKYENSSWIKNNKTSKKRLKPYYLMMGNSTQDLAEAVNQLYERLLDAQKKGLGMSVEFVVIDLYLFLTAVNRLLQISDMDSSRGRITEALELYEYFMVTSKCTSSMGNMYFKEHIEEEYKKLKDF